MVKSNALLAQSAFSSSFINTPVWYSFIPILLMKMTKLVIANVAEVFKPWIRKHINGWGTTFIWTDFAVVSQHTGDKES